MILFIVGLIVGLMGIIIAVISILNPSFSIINYNNTQVESEKTIIGEDIPITSITPPNGTKTDEKFDYHFVVQGQSAIASDKLARGLAVDAKKVSIPNTYTINRIIIPAMGVDVPIIEGTDGESAIDQGWWLYPASKERGEKVYLAHRRYWGKDHPYSAWDINTLKIGAKIKLVGKNGKVYTYKVKSQAVKDGVDLGIFRASADDLVKIITCSTWTGDPGSADYRYVTIAERAE